MGKKKSKKKFHKSSSKSEKIKDPFPFPLRMWNLGHCDPKRCSGVALQHRGVIRELRLNQSFRGIILSPEASVVVSSSDQEIVQNLGVSVIDCSWNRIDEVDLHRFHGGL